MANTTLTTAGQQVLTPEQAQAQAQAQAIAQAKAQIIAVVPGAIEKDGAEHQKLTKALPSRDRQKAYERMRKKAAKSGGNYTVDGKPVEVEVYIQQIEQANANGVPVKVKGAGTKGGVFLFQPTGEMQMPQQQQEQQEEEKKGGFLDWCKRNWYWLVAGAAAIGVGVYFLVRHNRKDKKKVNVQANKESSDVADSTLNNKNDPLTDSTIKNNEHNGTPGDGTTNVDLIEKLQNGSIQYTQDIGPGDNQQQFANDFWAAQSQK